MKNVILISPDESWNIAGQKFLTEAGFMCDFADKGKQAQLMIHAKEYQYAFLDLMTASHSGLEVFKFLRSKNSYCKVFLIVPGDAFFEGNAHAEERLLKSGAVKVLRAPAPAQLLDHLTSLGAVKRTVALKEHVSSGPEEEATIDDATFTKVELASFFEDIVAVTDFYIRIGQNRYVKVVHQGEKISGERFKKYADNGAEFIYFPTKDRILFLGQQNQIAEAILKVSKTPGPVVVMASGNASDKFFEELDSKGIQPQLLEEGKALCRNLYEGVSKDPSLKKMFSDLEKFNPQAFNEAFLVTLFSSIISKDLPWVGQKSIETLGMGALLHDIGTLQLDAALVAKKYSDMTPEEKIIFHQHPLLGAEAVKGIPGITAGVQLIIQHHHECHNGSGYPLGITFSKIYPLAKVVGLANRFAEFLLQNSYNPLDGLKVYLADKENIVKDDPDLIKSLILGIK